MKHPLIRFSSERQNSKRSLKPFTLIEICLAIALLGMLAGVVGWQLKKMVALHHFRKHITLFVADLRKLQIIALSRRCDFSLSIYRTGNEWFYIVKSDEPIALYGKERPIPLKGVHSLVQGEKRLSQLDLMISPAGSIYPFSRIGFCAREPDERGEETIWLDLRFPLQVILSYSTS